MLEYYSDPKKERIDIELDLLIELDEVYLKWCPVDLSELVFIGDMRYPARADGDTGSSLSYKDIITKGVFLNSKDIDEINMHLRNNRILYRVYDETKPFLATNIFSNYIKQELYGSSIYREHFVSNPIHTDGRIFIDKNLLDGTVESLIASTAHSYCPLKLDDNYIDEILGILAKISIYLKKTGIYTRLLHHIFNVDISNAKYVSFLIGEKIPEFRYFEAVKAKKMYDIPQDDFKSTNEYILGGKQW